MHAIKIKEDNEAKNNTCAMFAYQDLKNAEKQFFDLFIFSYTLVYRINYEIYFK